MLDTPHVETREGYAAAARRKERIPNGVTVMRRVTIFAALAFLGLASAAYAHPKLVSATPAANATVAKPGRVQLYFSEKLMAKFSGADLTVARKGMASMKMTSTAVLAPDGRTLLLTPKSPLPAGRYNVAWHVVSVDTHRVAGTYAFAVK